MLILLLTQVTEAGDPSHREFPHESDINLEGPEAPSHEPQIAPMGIHQTQPAAREDSARVQELEMSVDSLYKQLAVSEMRLEVWCVTRY